MAIVGNTMTEIGDVMFVTSSPVLGLNALTGYVLSLNGETGTRTCSKEFSYSMEGVSWSPFQALTIPNVSAVVPNPLQPFMVRLKLTRGGSDATGVIEFASFDLTGTYAAAGNTNAFASSIFNQFFTALDQDHVEWCTNMFVKLYERGIVPNYIVRGEDSNANGEDDDYISFWLTVSCFFAWHVVYARTIMGITDREDLLYDYLTERGIGVCQEPDMVTMLYITGNYYDEIRKRGTKWVFEEANTSGTNPVAGEFLRLICKGAFDEFKYVMTDDINFGWVIGRSSPMFRGTGGDYQLIKGYENTQDMVDSSPYPIIDPPNAIFNTPYLGNSTLALNAANSGIGWSGGFPDKSIIIDPAINYEITFSVLSKNIGNEFEFGVDFFDKAGNHLASNSIDGTPSSDVFFTAQPLNQIDQYYFIRGIMFGVNEPIRGSDGVQLDIGFGKHMKIPCGAVQFIPKLIMTTAAGRSYVYDFKVRIADTPYSRGFVQTPNVIQVWAKNNNGRYVSKLVDLNHISHPISNQVAVSIPLLEDFTRRHLIPYDSMIVFNWLGETDACPT